MVFMSNEYDDGGVIHDSDDKKLKDANKEEVILNDTNKEKILKNFPSFKVGGFISKGEYEKIYEEGEYISTELPKKISLNNINFDWDKFKKECSNSIKLPNANIPNLNVNTMDKYQCADMQKEQLERRKREHI